MNLNKHSKVRAVGLSCFLALTVLFGLAVFCPFNGSNEETYAADITKTGNISIDFVLQKVATGNISIDFLLAPMLSVSIDNLNATTTQTYNPTTTQAAEVKQVARFSVGTNCTNGYGIFVYGNSTSLNGSGNNKIESTDAETTLALMQAGKWGFNLAKAEYMTIDDVPGTAVFSPMPTTKGNAAASSDDKTPDDTPDKYTLTFGAKIGYETYADTYTNTVKVQVVASGTSTTSISENVELHDSYIEGMKEIEAQERAAKGPGEEIKLGEIINY